MLFQQDGTIESKTVTHQDFAAKKGDRYPTVVPKDSDLLPRDGSLASETSKNAEYTAKTGERYELVRPEPSDIWKVSFEINASFE